MTLRSAPAGQVDWTEADYRILQRALADGVYDGRDSLKVVADGASRTVRVLTGRARIQGAALMGEPGVTGNASATHAAEFTLTAPGSGLYRVDVIAMRYNPDAGIPVSDRVTIITRSGPTSSTRDGAARPALTRNRTGAWEVPLAWVRAGSVAITQADIEDARAIIDVQPAFRSLYHPQAGGQPNVAFLDQDSIIAPWFYQPGDPGYSSTGDIDYGQGIVTLNIQGIYEAELSLTFTGVNGGVREVKIVDVDSGEVYARSTLPAPYTHSTKIGRAHV